MKETVATKHARKRMKERMNIGAKSADRQSELAKERGIPHSQTIGRLHKWITSQWAGGVHGGRTYIVYNSKLFIFSACTVYTITVLDIPPNLRKVSEAQCKRAKLNRLMEV